MEIPTYILFLLGCLGAADIALFHSVAHGIRSHPDSVAELVTHSLRGPTYATLFLFIPNFEMHGLFAWCLMALLAFDVGISIWDFSLEQGSRRLLGGLPSGEYVLHMVMAIVFGALVATIACFGQHWFAAHTRLVYRPAAVPTVLRFALAIMAVAVFVSGIQDAAAALRLRRFGRNRSSRVLAQSGPSEAHLKPLAATVARPEPHTRADIRVQKTPRGFRIALCAAGIYNLLWGALVVLFPEALFRWAGAPVPNYPQIWQCVGMLVGVYGFGYLIATRDPFRHWAVILVGLLGKILGPVGMGWSIAHNHLPARMAWICVPNDLIWWGPFALILWRVATRQQKTTGQ